MEVQEHPLYPVVTPSGKRVHLFVGDSGATLCSIRPKRVNFLHRLLPIDTALPFSICLRCEESGQRVGMDVGSVIKEALSGGGS